MTYYTSTESTKMDQLDKLMRDVRTVKEQLEDQLAMIESEVAALRKDGIKNQKPIETPNMQFLMKRGLKRDRANFVSAVIKFRNELRLLRKMISDEDVIESLNSLDDMIADEVSLIYIEQSLDERTTTP